MKIEKNFDFISYSKLINYDFIKLIQSKYDFILIENNLQNKKELSKKITKNSKADILVIRPNLVGIKNAKEIIKEKELKDVMIIINNYNQYSIDEQ